MDEMDLLDELARTQGRLMACEEIIARTRSLAESYQRPPMTWAGTRGPYTEGRVPVSEILEALGPAPTDE